MEAITQQLFKLKTSTISPPVAYIFECDLCDGKDHNSIDCLNFGRSRKEKVDYVGQGYPQNRQGGFFNNNNRLNNNNYQPPGSAPAAVIRPNFGLNPPQQPYPNQRPQPTYYNPNKDFDRRPQNQGPPGYQTQPQYKGQTSGASNNQTEDMRRVDMLEKLMLGQQASISNIELQMSNLAKILSERPPGTLPSHTENNPKEQLKVITLRSGKGTEPLPMKITKPSTPSPMKSPKNVIMEADLHNEKTELNLSSEPTLPPYQPKAPYPARLNTELRDAAYQNFLDLLGKVHVNIPFIAVISKMPHL
ncbi:unnamed protein product [Linum trigynum]|uniref:Reverse transcriptase domain-containing protein n=1 Tax=Linum trigynum TaxID=586398 RepID=A0AAV2ESU5_9ROSI